MTASYPTKAAQKTALNAVAQSFEAVAEGIRNELLSMPTRDDSWDDLYFGLPHLPHEWKPRHAATYGERWPEAVAAIDTLLAEREQIKATPIVKRTSERATKRAADESKRATCQICGRKIMASNGIIADHGYRRPGYGFNTRGCFGQRHQPLEVSTARLVEYIEILAVRLVEAETERDARWFADEITVQRERLARATS